MLVHFFSHVGEEKVRDNDNNENGSVASKTLEAHSNESSIPLNLTKNETLNPWKYCLATYGENDNKTSRPLKKVKEKKKEKNKTFECNLCNKKFGWSTDLKRHLLIHTGTIFDFKSYKC